jgi:ArsR family transcriptional regulator
MKLQETQIIFGALADTTRFRILNLLAEGELCVCDIMQVLNVPQSKISRHLSYLRRSGLVDARKEGLWMYYSLAKPKLKMTSMLLVALDASRKDFPELQKDLIEFQKNKKRLVSCCD